jgi:hypothetical protein
MRLDDRLDAMLDRGHVRGQIGITVFAADRLDGRLHHQLKACGVANA